MNPMGFDRWQEAVDEAAEIKQIWREAQAAVRAARAAKTSQKEQERMTRVQRLRVGQ